MNYFVLQYPYYFYNFMIRFWNFYKCSNLQTECGECKSKMEFSFSFFQTKFSKVSTNQNKNSDESQTSQSKYYRNGYVPTFMKTVSSGDTFQKHSFCNYVHSFCLLLIWATKIHVCFIISGILFSGLRIHVGWIHLRGLWRGQVITI